MFSNYAYLYVEDDPLSREIMQMILENVMDIQNFTILSDSSSFMEQIGTLSRKPDVIMLDIHVKPYSGFEMLNMLRANPLYTNAKIIALTASVMSEEVEKLRLVGFDGAIAKPLSMQTFPDMMSRVLAGESVWHIA
jgi:CheY-like chemotaxis protein